jgi:hypothetical protein
MFGHCKTLDELKTAYRKESLKHHPDKGGSAETFMEINRQMAKRKRELLQPPRPNVNLPPELVDLLEKEGEKLVDAFASELRKTMLGGFARLLKKMGEKQH